MSKTIEIRVPDIGDFSGVPVIEILVAEGDQVATEDSLVTLESDKATMEVPSPADGIIREIKVKLDDTVSEGDRSPFSRRRLSLKKPQQQLRRQKKPKPRCLRSRQCKKIRPPPRHQQQNHQFPGK